MTWLLLLTSSLAFASGWTAHSWSCSRRRDCPRYAEYRLSKWKREVEQQVGRLSRPGDRPPPAEEES